MNWESWITKTLIGYGFLITGLMISETRPLLAIFCYLIALPMFLSNLLDKFKEM